MNRYSFWIFMIIPFAVLTYYNNTSETHEQLGLLLGVTLVYLSVVVNIRRKRVGLTIKETLVAYIPFWGWKERKQLYFKK